MPRERESPAGAGLSWERNVSHSTTDHHLSLSCKQCNKKRHKKTCSQGLRPGLTQTGLCRYEDG